MRFEFVEDFDEGGAHVRGRLILEHDDGYRVCAGELTLLREEVAPLRRALWRGRGPDHTPFTNSDLPCERPPLSRKARWTARAAGFLIGLLVFGFPLFWVLRTSN